MPKNELLHSLQQLEKSLFDTDKHRDIAHLDTLLHVDFVEFGRSGRQYNKSEILQEAPFINENYSIEAKDFELAVLGEGVALLNYTSFNVDTTGKPAGYTLRSSLWLQTSNGWQLRFHQGTPVDETAMGKS